MDDGKTAASRIRLRRTTDLHTRRTFSVLLASQLTRAGKTLA